MRIYLCVCVVFYVDPLSLCLAVCALFISFFSRILSIPIGLSISLYFFLLLTNDGETLEAVSEKGCELMVSRHLQTLTHYTPPPLTRAVWRENTRHPDKSVPGVSTRYTGVKIDF